jgi:hypothetical protein
MKICKNLLKNTEGLDNHYILLTIKRRLLCIDNQTSIAIISCNHYQIIRLLIITTLKTINITLK